MIGYLKGNVISQNNGVVILETGGVGFEITCSSSAYIELVNAKKGAVYTYMHVKEDGISLYGFISQEEKSMFLKLISVSGVGPKMGITVLSSMPLKNLAYIIASSDVKGLSAVKGLGKKTAERIILELRENISSLDLPEGTKPAKKNEPTLNPLVEDGVIALMSLGFNRVDSKKAVDEAISRGADTIETIITIALQTIK